MKNDIIRELENLKNLISQKKKKQAIIPVFKWGQNKKKTFLFIKLSHRFDAPGCLEFSDEKPFLKIHSNKFIFEVNCVQATQPLVFKLDFDLFDLVKEEFEIEKRGVGTLKITLEKNKEGIWKDLFQNFEDRYLFKAKIWYELEEVFKKDMEEFYRLNDEYVDLKKKEKKKKNKKKRKRKRGRICRDPYLNIYEAFKVYNKVVCLPN